MRPATPDIGAVHVASIFFPRDFARLDAEPDSRRDGWWSDPVFYFAPALVGEAVEFLFFYTKTPEAMERELARVGKPLFYSTLEPSDESVVLVVRTRPIDAATVPHQLQVPSDSLYDGMQSVEMTIRQSF